MTTWEIEVASLGGEWAVLLDEIADEAAARAQLARVRRYNPNRLSRLVRVKWAGEKREREVVE